MVDSSKHDETSNSNSTIMLGGTVTMTQCAPQRRNTHTHCYILCTCVHTHRKSERDRDEIDRDTAAHLHLQYVQIGNVYSNSKTELCACLKKTRTLHGQSRPIGHITTLVCVYTYAHTCMQLRTSWIPTSCPYRIPIIHTQNPSSDTVAFRQ